MKIDRIELHGFLSHRDTTWSPNGARLVALVGPNGAGKSSLAVDAPLYALFDDARSKRADELVQLGSSDMSATIEFVHDRARYRVTRGRTTRAGGKSHLELHVQAPDGSWRPLTGPTIRDTQTSIEELLRVDAATFETAVVLVQGDAMRFANATAAERKRIVSTILGLDVYARAERAARDRDLELTQAARDQQSRLDRIDDAIAELAPIADSLAVREAAVARIASDITAAAADRIAADTRLVDLAGGIAVGEAAEAEAGQIDVQLETFRERYRRARDRRESAGRMLEMANTTLGAEATVLAAASQIFGLEQAVRVAEEREHNAIALDERIRRDRDSHVAATAAFDREYATWQANYAAARRRVDQLAAAVTGLLPLECPKCQHRWHHDQAGLQAQLTAARKEFRDLEAGQPKPITGSAAAAAAIERLEGHRRELGDVRSPLNTARGELSRAEAQAARLDAIEGARATRDQAVQDIGSADVEIDEANQAGTAARERKTALEAAIAAIAGFRAERSAVLGRVEELARRTTDLNRQHAEALGSVVRLRALLERRDQLVTERKALIVEIATTATDAVRTKKLVTAFGVTGIPARIIEGVLPELEGYAQELLGELRPGMTLSLRAQRARRDGAGVIEALDLIVRDTAGERPLQLFSGGEKVSVCLALAVGLSRLVARRAGAALRTLIVDEPDGLDAQARRAFGQALRVLAHRGELERTVLVTHHADLAEFADEIHELANGPTGSTLALVA